MNTLFYGDNLTVLRDSIPDESVDLVYLDPPFNSNRDYNVIFKDESGRKSDAQLLAFEETGSYRLLLPAMSEDPAELRRFYSDTIEPLITYDEQYGTELVTTLATFLANDGSWKATAADLRIHRQTLVYRLRIRAGLSILTMPEALRDELPLP